MRSWCFDSVATEVDGVMTYDREYGSAEFREVISKLVGNGIYANPASNMQVVVAGGLNVAVQPGCCWIQGAFGVVDEAETLTIEPSTNGRYDAIVARFDLSLASRDIHLAVVKGTEGSLMRPTLTRNASVYELQLASIYVNANVTAISTTDITDTRYSSSYCGIVTGVIDQINTTGLFIQYEGQFYKFLNEIKNSLTGDVAGNLLMLIDSHTKNLNNPHNVTREQLGIGSSCHQDRLLGGACEFEFTDLIPQAIIVTFSYSNNLTQNAGYETVVMPRESLAEANFDSFRVQASFLPTNNGYTFTITAPTHADSIYLGYRFVAVY